jgi:DNA-binding NtrC family response regulator
MTQRRKLAVLIVDDSFGVRESLKATLEMAGHEAVALENSREGMEALSTRRFDALVTDLWMPGVDGVELLRLAQNDHPELRLVAITGGGPGMSIETAAALARTWQAERVFVKPFDERELVAFLEQNPGDAP